VSFYLFVLSCLAVWRITHLLATEDGPFDLLVRLRRLLGAGALGRLMDCFGCLSLWVAIPFAWLIGDGWLERGLSWPALSGAAMLLQRITDRGPPPAAYHEDEEDADGMLRAGPGEAGGNRRPEDDRER